MKNGSNDAEDGLTLLLSSIFKRLGIMKPFATVKGSVNVSDTFGYRKTKKNICENMLDYCILKFMTVA